jgi:hypothetical protein
MSETGLERLVEERRLNAALAWVLVGFVVLVALGNVLTGNLMWAVFAGAVAALALFPPVASRSTIEMLPWEVLLLAVFPLLGRTFASVPMTGNLAQYLSVAALALIIAVELHVFTPVEMSVGFAVGFVVIATTAAAGIWAVARWVPDVLLGTTFLLQPGVPERVIEHRLMWEFVWSTAAGVLAGVVFEWYFRRRGRAEVREVVE